MAISAQNLIIREPRIHRHWYLFVETRLWALDLPVSPPSPHFFPLQITEKSQKPTSHFPLSSSWLGENRVGQQNTGSNQPHPFGSPGQPESASAVGNKGEGVEEFQAHSPLLTARAEPKIIGLLPACQDLLISWSIKSLQLNISSYPVPL